MSDSVNPEQPQGKGEGIKLEGVNFQYPNSQPIVSNLSLDIAAGEFFVLLGPSGCGKTTVLNLIAGFESVTSGSLTVGGSAVSGPGMDRSVVFQGDESLLGWRTVRQNVEFGLEISGFKKEERRARSEVALRTVGLSEHEKKFPRELSGGMKQRVQIARALVSDAPVLLMDEPFGALDAMTRTSLQDEISRIWAEDRRTVVFITHDIAEAVTLGTRIGVMTGGDSSQIAFMDNPLPRPRHRGTVEYGRLYEQIEQELGESIARHQSRKAQQ